MSNNPRVSIGLPVYNGEKYLRDALESILSQTYTDFELIISDNASTDATKSICVEYASKDKRIKYHRNKVNLGASKNHNLVVQHATGDYFKWAAYDDLLAPTYLAKCAQVLDNDPTVVLSYPITGCIDADGQLKGNYEDNLKVDDKEPSQRFEDLITFRNNGWLILLGLIRLSALKKTPLMGNYISADRNLVAELSLIGPFEEIKELLFYRRAHDGSYTNKKDKNDLKEKYYWWSATSGSLFVFPHWKIFKEYNKSVKRSELIWSQRCACYLKIFKWLINEGLFLIGLDFVLNFSSFVNSHSILQKFFTLVPMRKKVFKKLAVNMKLEF